MENFLKITLRLCCSWHLSILQSKALVQMMSISQAAVALQRQGQRCCKNMPGKSQRCTLLFCITDCLGFFKNYYLLNHSPDERAESSPWWQVKKTQQLFLQSCQFEAINQIRSITQDLFLFGQPIELGEKRQYCQPQVRFQGLHRIIYFEGWYNQKVVSYFNFMVNLLDNLQQKQGIKPVE